MPLFEDWKWWDKNSQWNRNNSEIEKEKNHEEEFSQRERELEDEIITLKKQRE
jgi:hypothetical protein